MKIILSGLFFFSLCLNAQDLTNGLLINYAFDNNFLDSSINHNDGFANGPVFTTDRNSNINSAVYFDGINDYINFPNSNELKPSLPVSFSFWIKYDSNSYQNQVVFNTSFEQDRSAGIWFNSSSSSNGYAVNFGNGNYNFISSTRNTFVANQSISTANWQHVVVVVNSVNNMQIYVDCNNLSGNFSGSATGLVYSNEPGVIGRHDRVLSQPEDYFKGSLDEFKYWNRALTNAEINILCSATLSNDDISSMSNENIYVYPNPAFDELNFSTDINFEQVEIYNSIGQLVLKKSFSSIINISELSEGIYFIKLYNSDDSRQIIFSKK
ncbi:LamG-like jellyroll fold domain-containing protein [Flavobacterium sp.]|jgi:hypothetical protein|uniref:LamG-like jellyroll fold domain-containing protein n=1 Tax=Flavobacterium sp. TaxID=239 RepID=UPI002A80FD09|nr:LamG-like jellyroll fold domain-containing protein [Flavobacterium sp.]